MLNLICKFVKMCPLFIVSIFIPNPLLKICVFSTLLFWCTSRTIKYYKKLPPGPWGIPLLGYLPFMYNKPPHKLYLELSDRYGDVFSIQLGSDLVVGLGSAKLMRDLFNRSDSTNRPKTPLSKLLRGFGIILSEGLLWKRQRTFLHEKFRALGVKLYPNRRIEKYIIAEIEELFSILDMTQGNAVNPHDIFGRHVHNVICQLMMSFRFEKDDPEFITFNEKISRGMKLFGMVHLGEHFKPYLHLPGKQVVLKEIKKNLVDVSQFHAKHLNDRIKNRSKSVHCSGSADLLDHYLDKVDNQNNGQETKTQIFPGVEPDKQIIQVMNDLFSAGMETSRSTLLWCVVMMLREPEAAKRVRQDLRKIVAPTQVVTMEHRLSLPYVEAVIFETMRLCSIVPLGTIHVNDTAWHVDGYTIPAGTHIVPLINKMNMDPQMYPEPEQFIPERFIKEGKLHSADFLQFGVGQRMCLGNLLARMELFLFFANIMNRFELSLPTEDTVPSLEGVLGVTHAPFPYKLLFTNIEH